MSDNAFEVLNRDAAAPSVKSATEKDAKVGVGEMASQVNTIRVRARIIMVGYMRSRGWACACCRRVRVLNRGVGRATVCVLEKGLTPVPSALPPPPVQGTVIEGAPTTPGRDVGERCCEGRGLFGPIGVGRVCVPWSGVAGMAHVSCCLQHRKGRTPAGVGGRDGAQYRGSQRGTAASRAFGWGNALCVLLLLAPWQCGD